MFVIKVKEKFNLNFFRLEIYYLKYLWEYLYSRGLDGVINIISVGVDCVGTYLYIYIYILV